MKRLIRIKQVLWIFAMFGLVAMCTRLIQGLGATTALSDSLPWGLWKIGNMVAGVCLGTCGFIMAIVVVVFKRKAYEYLLKPAILIAFLGYGSSAFSLVLDIGLPWRIWQPMIYWNIHSFLFEVAMCVMFYFTVTTIEMVPIVTESKWHDFAHKLHYYSYPAVLLGITLSCMHHTTLGSLFLTSPTRMHEIWFSPWIWGIFISSSAASGLFFLCLIMLMICNLYGRKPDMKTLGNVATGGSVLLVIYALFKIADLTNRGVWGTIFSGEWEGIVFIIESILLVIAPLTLMIMGARKNKSLLSLAASSVSIGIVMNRLDAGIIAFFRDAGAVYFPTLEEIFVTLGVYSAAGLVFFAVLENFHVLEKPPFQIKGKPDDSPLPDVPLARAARGTFLEPLYNYSGVIVVSFVVALGVFSNSIINGTPLINEKVQPPTSQDPQREILIINGNKDDVAVEFEHAKHMSFPGVESCETCHHIDQPDDRNTACSKCHTSMQEKNDIFKHSLHQEKLGGNKGCDNCHPKEYPEGMKGPAGEKPPKWRTTAKRCYECHEENMRMEKPTEKFYDYMAPSYVDAMHRMCVECHIEKQSEVNTPTLEECHTCHGDVKLWTVVTPNMR